MFGLFVACHVQRYGHVKVSGQNSYFLYLCQVQAVEISGHVRNTEYAFVANISYSGSIVITDSRNRSWELLTIFVLTFAKDF